MRREGERKSRMWKGVKKIEGKEQILRPLDSQTVKKDVMGLRTDVTREMTERTWGRREYMEYEHGRKMSTGERQTH